MVILKTECHKEFCMIHENWVFQIRLKVASGHCNFKNLHQLMMYWPFILNMQFSSFQHQNYKHTNVQLPDDGINVKRFDRPKNILALFSSQLNPFLGKQMQVENFRQSGMLNHGSVFCFWQFCFKIEFFVKLRV